MEPVRGSSGHEKLQCRPARPTGLFLPWEWLCSVPARCPASPSVQRTAPRGKCRLLPPALPLALLPDDQSGPGDGLLRTRLLAVRMGWGAPPYLQDPGELEGREQL